MIICLTTVFSYCTHAQYVSSVSIPSLSIPAVWTGARYTSKPLAGRPLLVWGTLYGAQLVWTHRWARCHIANSDCHRRRLNFDPILTLWLTWKVILNDKLSKLINQKTVLYCCIVCAVNGRKYNIESWESKIQNSLEYIRYCSIQIFVCCNEWISCGLVPTHSHSYS